MLLMHAILPTKFARCCANRREYEENKDAKIQECLSNGGNQKVCR